MTKEQPIAGKIEWFDDRFYKVYQPPEFEESLWYKSSTTILNIIDKPWLRQWYGDLGTEAAKHRSKMAMARGSAVHDIIHTLIESKQDFDGTPVPQEIWVQVCKAYQWLQSLKPEILGSEVEICNHDLQYAGTLDLAFNLKGGKYNVGYVKEVELPGGTWIGDWKTGATDFVHKYQAASYAKAWEKMRGGKVAGTMIMYLNTDTKTGWKCETRTGEQIDDDFEKFKAAKVLSDARDMEKPKVLELPTTLSFSNGQA